VLDSICGSTVFFKGKHGKYIRHSELDHEKPPRVDVDKVGTWEKFSIVPGPDDRPDTVAIRSERNGMFISAWPHEDKTIRFGQRAGPWEAFHLQRIGSNGLVRLKADSTGWYLSARKDGSLKQVRDAHDWEIFCTQIECL
jgi:hypothetical protein